MLVFRLAACVLLAFVLSTAKAEDKLALTGEWALKAQVGGKDVTGTFEILEVKAPKAFTASKNGGAVKEVEGKFSWEGANGSFTGTMDGMVLFVNTSDGKQLTLLFTDWAPAKMGLGTWREKKAPEKSHFLQVARATAVSKRPEPNGELVKALVANTFTLSGGEVLDVSKVTNSGVVEGKLGTVELMGAVLGNVVVFSIPEKGKKYVIIFAKDGKGWAKEEFVTALPPPKK